MIQETKFCVGIITHPAFNFLLDNHLESLSIAQKEFGKFIEIHLILSNVNSKEDIYRVKKILKKYKYLHVNFQIVYKKLTCGEARNYLIKYFDKEWGVFFDTDVVLHKSYFVNLIKVLSNIELNFPSTKGIAGGIGFYNESRIGKYEHLMDLYAYYGKIQNPEVDFNKIDLNNYISIKGAININLYSLEYEILTYLQGFNHIIHKDILEIGYDDNFFGAEDREISGKIISLGYEIRLAPNCLVYHYYNFSWTDIIRRKYGHGYYSAMFRKKYSQLNKFDRGFKKWSKYTISLFAPPQCFRTRYGVFLPSRVSPIATFPANVSPLWACEVAG
jgi:hypothetical protein